MPLRLSHVYAARNPVPEIQGSRCIVLSEFVEYGMHPRRSEPYIL